jgi:hypothetical protein
MQRRDVLGAPDQEVFISFGFSQSRTRFSEKQYDIWL